MRASRKLLILGLAFALSLVMAGSALASTVNVSIVDFAFNPAAARARMGDTVKWTNNGSTHTVTSDGTDPCCPNGPALFASGSVGTGGTFSFVFNTAGKYNYHCSIHTNMKASVSVGMKAVPPSGTQTTQFTITWAANAIPATYNMDIQISRPGQGFVNWKLNRTGTMLSSTFTPDAGAGTYKFRALLQKGTSATLKSGFSAAKSITVT
jgi:plastocyanin